jgi:hypothetical protein
MIASLAASQIRKKKKKKKKGPPAAVDPRESVLSLLFGAKFSKLANFFQKCLNMCVFWFFKSPNFYSI